MSELVYRVIRFNLSRVDTISPVDAFALAREHSATHGAAIVHAVSIWRNRVVLSVFMEHGRITNASHTLTIEGLP